VFKLRKPWLIRPAGTLAANVIRMLMGTVRRRIAVAGTAPFPPPPPATGAYLYVFWHEFLLPMTTFNATKIHVLTSLHADGELMTRVLKHLKFGIVRGSTTRGGSKALLGLIRRVGASHVALTPDGPVGPRRRAKAGAAALAGMTGMPIVPIGIGCSADWRAASWDRMMIPRPWATSYFVTGPTIRVPAGLDRAGLTRYSRQIENALGTVTAAAERWAAGGPRPVLAVPLAACA
jgi:lysophospholipid acyltransferase (LPLAT)-like uncharacterized protein